MNRSKLVYIDTETSGIDAEAKVVQVAFLVSKTRELVNQTFDPGVELNHMATATHHIPDAVIKASPPFKGSHTEKRLVELNKNGSIFVAHNASFDQRMLRRDGIELKRTIDTLRLARKYLDAPNNKLQFLRYHLGLEVEAQAHDAEGDVLVLERLFLHLYALAATAEKFRDPIIESFTKVDEFTPATTCHFGKKHKGKPMKQVLSEDRQYLEWFLGMEKKKKKKDKDLVRTIEHYLK